MIKVYNLKQILKLLILAIVAFILVLLAVNKINSNKLITVSTQNDITYKILVDVEDSKLYLFENEVLIKTYSCSGGKWSTPSPIGTWTVVQKAKWGEGFRR